MSRLAVEGVLLYDGPYPHVDGLLAQVTNRLDTLEVLHLPRASGQSTYTLRRLVRLWLTLALNFSILPLRLSVLLGFLMGLPLFAVVQVDRLQLSYSEIGYLGLAQSICWLLGNLYWGRLLDRRGGLWLMRANLGIAVESVKRRALLLAVLLVASAVALCGVIGFIGLVVPHAVRLLLGPDHRLVLPGSALLGAGLLLWADLASRTVVAPAELPLGIVTASIGGPFFLSLLLRERQKWSAR